MRGGLSTRSARGWQHWRSRAGIDCCPKPDRRSGLTVRVYPSPATAQTKVLWSLVSSGGGIDPIDRFTHRPAPPSTPTHASADPLARRGHPGTAGDDSYLSSALPPAGNVRHSAWYLEPTSMPPVSLCGKGAGICISVHEYRGGHSLPRKVPRRGSLAGVSGSIWTMVMDPTGQRASATTAATEKS